MNGSWREDVEALTRDWGSEALGLQALQYVGEVGSHHARDVALAFGVANGNAAALRQFNEEVTDALQLAIRSIDHTQNFVDELTQVVRMHLCVGEPGRPPRIERYRGMGPLRAWVAIAARRMALNAKRSMASRPDREDVLTELVDREPDPEVRHLKTLYRSEFKEALKASVAALSDRSRAVLRLRFVEGLELSQLGQLYRVHESTASRWVAAALDEVAEGARANLKARLAFSSASVDSVTRMVRSGLDLSVATLLR